VQERCFPTNASASITGRSTPAKDDLQDRSVTALDFDETKYLQRRSNRA
jgi:hypothetical protein